MRPGFSLTDVVAWWGAAIATFLLAWDIYKWLRRGADVRVKATPNMQIFPPPPAGPNPRYIHVEAVNHGAQPTTITQLSGAYYPSAWRRFARRPTSEFVVVLNPLGPPLPYVLKPGERWVGGISQDDAISKFGPTGTLCCGVACSTVKKAVYKRVRLRNVRATSPTL
jgi:hypothetical protein